MKSIFSFTLFLLSIASIYISYLCFKSFQGFDYLRTGSAKIKNVSDFDSYFSGLPNISPASIPVDAFRAEILLKNGDYKNARVFLKKASSVNPHIGYSDFLLSNYYYIIGNIDSSQFYAEKAFRIWPKSIDNYNILNKVYAYQGDTLSIIGNYIKIKDYFLTRDEYYQSFIRHYALAKYSNYVIDYPDKRQIKLNELYGEWVEIHNRNDGLIKYDLSKSLNFSKNSIFSSSTSKFFYSKSADTISLSSINSRSNIITKFTVQYSDEYKTLVVNFDPRANRDVKFFKKVSDLNLQN